ncbi:hypothetical protein L1887_55315 [Cichorium endivia]|nr:hypothetical protein L1887_55315 [Cichorium endivia]
MHSRSAERGVVECDAHGGTVVSVIPDLEQAIFAAGHEPLHVAMPRDARHVALMPLERGDGLCRSADIGVGTPTVGGSNARGRGYRAVVQSNVRVGRRGEEALVGADGESVDLRVWMLDGARADARPSLPEADGVVVARGDEQHRQRILRLGLLC